MKPKARPALAPIAVHGSPDHQELRRLGISSDQLLDFSANINPFGPSPRARAALAAVLLDRYPDRDCLRLCDALSRQLGVLPECILVGNGSSEVIALAAQAFAGHAAAVLVLGPTYSEYARAALLAGAEVVHVTAREETDFSVDPQEVVNVIGQRRPGIVFVCNPNNPTGRVIPPGVIAGWAADHPASLFVVDEAYQPFAVGLESMVQQALENVLVLRSLTKDHALAGLRLGYAVGDREAIEALARCRPPWSVNAAAQLVGLAALADAEHVTRTLAALRQATERLVGDVKSAGLTVLPSAVHFFLVRVGDAAATRLALLRQGMLVRDCASFGLPEHIRIASRTAAHNDRLVAVLREVLR